MEVKLLSGWAELCIVTGTTTDLPLQILFNSSLTSYIKTTWSYLFKEVWDNFLRTVVKCYFWLYDVKINFNFNKYSKVQPIYTSLDKKLKSSV